MLAEASIHEKQGPFRSRHSEEHGPQPSPKRKAPLSAQLGPEGQRSRNPRPKLRKPH